MLLASDTQYMINHITVKLQLVNSGKFNYLFNNTIQKTFSIVNVIKLGTLKRPIQPFTKQDEFRKAKPAQDSIKPSAVSRHTSPK